MRDKAFVFRPGKASPQFDCDWAVFPENGNISVCYCTDKIRARLVSIALNRFLNSDEGKKWFEKNIERAYGHCN